MFYLFFVVKHPRNLQNTTAEHNQP